MENKNLEEIKTLNEHYINEDGIREVSTEKRLMNIIKKGTVLDKKKKKS